MNTTIRLKLGKRIKELRIKRGYTQEKLSETANIDYKYMQKIEEKNRFFRLKCNGIDVRC